MPITLRDGAVTLKGDGGRADFSKNIPTSLFNEHLSNKPNFGLIHLAGQYFPCELIFPRFGGELGSFHAGCSAFR